MTDQATAVSQIERGPYQTRLFFSGLLQCERLRISPEGSYED